MKYRDSNYSVVQLSHCVKIGDVVEEISYNNAIKLLNLLRQQNSTIEFMWFQGTKTYITIAVLGDTRGISHLEHYQKS